MLLRDVGAGAAHTTRLQPDSGLVEALRRDASTAAEMLVASYRDRVLRLARRITRSEEDAEEVAQDALWTVLSKINSFRGDAAFGSWVYRITANAALGKLRARKGKAGEIGFDDLTAAIDGVGGEFEPMDRTALPADAAALQAELRAALDRAIGDLRPDYRTALVLGVAQGLSHLNVADALGISVPAVKARVHRSRLVLRRKLEYLKTA